MTSLIGLRRNEAYSVSPHSSSGSGELLNATPASAITAFSPEVVRQFNSNIPVSKAGNTPVKEPLNDPFVAASAKKRPGAKLSATASEFRPYKLPLGSCNLTQPVTAQFLQEKLDATTEATEMGTFTQETNTSRCFTVAGPSGYDISNLVDAFLNKLGDAGWGPKGLFRKAYTPSIVYLRFSDIRDADYIVNALRLDNNGFRVEYLSCAAWTSAVSPGVPPPSEYEGQVYLEAPYPYSGTSLRKTFEEDMRKLIATAGSSLRAWEKISARESTVLKLIAELTDAAKVSNAIKLNGEKISGQINLTMIVKAHNPQGLELAKQKVQLTPVQAHKFDAKFNGRDVMRKAINKMGFYSQGQSSLNTPHMLASASPSAALTYTPTNRQYGLHGPPTLPHGSEYHHQHAVGGPPAHFGYASVGQTINNAPTSGYPLNGAKGNGHGQSGLQQQAAPLNSRYRPTAPAASNHSHSGYLPPVQRQFAVKVPRHRSPESSSQSNRVDLRRIEEGTDVKTTIMLRNIPNKIDQRTLKAIVDESSWGRYDFMYLRIDFSNNCNVGYAFINFIRAVDIINFVEARANKKWNQFNSDKIAEVSYATIQGRESLVGKFRNSSVMLEPEAHRPKLFYTIVDGRDIAGEEEPFAIPDNQAKLKRSCDNAEHVGLYAPRSGQHLRDEQRRRLSKYDRGTSLAAQEESHYGALKAEGRGRGNGNGRGNGRGRGRGRGGSNYRSY